jgi:hypothetical protein
MQNDQEDIKLAPWEAALLRHARQMDGRARSEVLLIAEAAASAHPRRPSRPPLRLVKSES